jgi:outer membrane protein assembly factor BamB
MKGEIVALDKSDGNLLWNPFTLEAPKSSGGFLSGCTPTASTVAIYGTPAVAGDLIYAGGYNGKIYALNSSSGALRWVYPREGNFEPVVGGPLVARDKLYFGGSDGTVYALDAATGDGEWEFETGGEIWSTPAVDGDTIFIGSFDKKLYALNADSGQNKWEFETEGAIASTPVVYNNTIYFGSFDRYLYAVDAAAGPWYLMTGSMRGVLTARYMSWMRKVALK